MTSSALILKGIAKSFDGKVALDDLTISFESGKIHALVGANGAGKSTLFRIILGLLTPDAGAASALGQDVAHLSPEDRARIGYVNEEHSLPGWLKVSVVKDGHKGLYSGWNEGVYQEVIAHFDVRPDQRVSSLSRGERAGLNLALALAQMPDLLILDEPTLGLDVVAKRAFLEALIDVNQRGGANSGGTTVIYCSHQMDEVERIADSLVILENGRLVMQSSPDDFVARIRQWHVSPALADFEHPCLQSRRTIDGDSLLVTMGHPADFEDLLMAAGAQHVLPSAVGIEIAVNAVLTPNHRKAAPKSAA